MGARIDMKMAELKKELEAAKKLPAVTGYDEEQKRIIIASLTSVESFMKDMQKARDKGSYSDEDYNAISEAYEYGLPLSSILPLFECELQSCSSNRGMFFLRKGLPSFNCANF